MSKFKIFFSKNNKSIKRFVAVVLTLTVVFSASFYIDNVTLDVEHINIVNGNLPKSFDGFKIAHISDYHNRNNTIFTKSVVKSVRENNPDIIVVTGDVIDCSGDYIGNAILFMKELVGIAPVYYVIGNHEVEVNNLYPEIYSEYLTELGNVGVNTLTNEKREIILSNGDSINIFGIDEVTNYAGDYTLFGGVIDSLLSDIEINENEFNILLAHHPEQIPTYSNYYFDLVFSGHAHGGQFRFFGQGILAPNQGFFPEYTSGLYEMNGTQLVVSRGIGNSRFPIRLFIKTILNIS